MKRFIVVAALLCLAASSVTLSASASSARKTRGTVWASANHSEGKTLFVSGDFKDKVLGRGALVYETRVRTGDQPNTVRIAVTRATIYTARGSLRGTGQGVQTMNPDGTATVSDGSFKLTKGTGKLAGHTMTGKLAGTFSDGIYTFKYTATLK